MARKQSISNDQIVGTEGTIELPSGAIPSIEGVRYIPEVINEGLVDSSIGSASRIRQLETPRDLKVEKQTIRFSPNGQQYVTVVVSFEGENLAIGHEVRIAEG
jgi:hypothetical protein